MRTAVALLAVLMAAVAGVVGCPSASGAAATRSIAVSTTLDRKTVLPHRILWQAFAKTPSSSIEEVDFLIDGKLRWIEHHTPYIYSGLDGRGYLVTSWLAPGVHRFTVFVKTTTGRSGSKTIRAKVLPTPGPTERPRGNLAADRRRFGGTDSRFRRQPDIYPDSKRRVHADVREALGADRFPGRSSCRRATTPARASTSSTTTPPTRT